MLEGLAIRVRGEDPERFCLIQAEILGEGMHGLVADAGKEAGVPTLSQICSRSYHLLKSTENSGLTPINVTSMPGY